MSGQVRRRVLRIAALLFGALTCASCGGATNAVAARTPSRSAETAAAEAPSVTPGPETPPADNPSEQRQPALALEGLEVSAQGLPAITLDGAVVAWFSRTDDSYLGNGYASEPFPCYDLDEIVVASGRLTTHALVTVVAHSMELDAASLGCVDAGDIMCEAPPGVLERMTRERTERLQRRLSDANEWLAARAWRPLVPVPARGEGRRLEVVDDDVLEENYAVRARIVEADGRVALEWNGSEDPDDPADCHFAQAEAFADPEGPTRVLRLLCTDQELEYAEYRVSGDAEPSER